MICSTLTATSSSFAPRGNFAATRICNNTQSVLDVPVCELPIVQPELMGPTPSSWQYVRQGEKSTGPCWVLRPRLKAHKEQTGERRICRLTLTVEPSNASIIHVVVTATIIISFFLMTIIIITVLSSDHVISQPEQTK